MKRVASVMGLALVPVLVGNFMSCGPEGMSELNDNSDPKLENVSDNYLTINGRISEYGSCRNTLDDDGDGLVDSHDPDCHIPKIDLLGVQDGFPDVLRDLSLYPYPFGHNFNPDVTRMIPLGAGFPGGFRDRGQITEWFRFLTEGNGYIADTQLFGPGVNPAFVPIPAPTAVHLNQGTFHPGNNNNIDPRPLHNWYLTPVPLAVSALAPCPAGIIATPAAPCANVAAAEVPILGTAPAPYIGVQYKGGSQGLVNPAKTGNVDEK